MTRRSAAWLAIGGAVCLVGVVVAVIAWPRGPGGQGGPNSPRDSGGLVTPSVRPAPSLRLDVRAFGALGDGVHDDTSAIQAAINAQQTRTVAAEVYLPAGTYRVSGLKDGPANPPRDSAIPLIVGGAGMQTTIIRTTSGAIWSVASGVVRVPQLVVSDITFDGNYLGVTPHPGFPTGTLDASSGAQMVNLPYPGQSISQPQQRYEGALHQFQRVRFYRAVGFVFQPTKAYITESVFDSDGQPDLPLRLADGDTTLRSPLAVDAPIDQLTLSGLNFRVWAGLKIVLNPGQSQQIVTSATTATRGDGPVNLAIKGGPRAAMAFPADTKVRFLRAHSDTLGSGGTTAIAVGNEFIDGVGNYADFVGSPTNAVQLVFQANSSTNYIQGGIYALGSGSRIVDNTLRNVVPGSGVGYDASASQSTRRGGNVIEGNSFTNIALPSQRDLAPNDRVVNNTVTP